MKAVRSFWRFASPASGVALLAAAIILLWPHATSAQYVGNNLIDDNIFLNANSMSQSQIQTFLTNRGGYLARYQLNFDCASTGTASNNAYAAAGAPCGQTVYASTIIYYAAQVYGLNPQAIMATLQKEQSLITATNPTASQLNFAMGYGCADSTGCASNSGFLHQVDDATWQFRMNYERAWGNNSWWNTTSRFACSGATKYYSTGLYPGRNVTFYDDHGAAYTSFVINDGATSSLYCYTPHAYPGSVNNYYSGSYNFVTAFENWFGSTQPTVVVSSPLRVSGAGAGAFAGSPITLSFDIHNNSNSSVNVGSMMIAVRDGNGGNYDFGLRPMTIAAGATATYSATTTLATEGSYTFWITNYANGQWNDNYPVSSLIDNARKLSGVTLQAMPTVTQAPSSSVASQHVGQSTNLSFQVKNNSANPVNLGTLGLAVRGPNGENLDVGYDTVSALAAGATYTYSKTFAPQQTGTYRVFMTDTTDGGRTWDATSFPASVGNAARGFAMNVLTNPTISSSLGVSDGATVRRGEQSQVSFQVHNYSAQAVNIERIGVMARDSAGGNHDTGWDDNVTIAAGQTYTYTRNVTWGVVGSWSLSVASYSSRSGWTTASPAKDDASVTTSASVVVKDNPTVTTGVAVSPASPRAGQAATVTYTVTNFSNQPVAMSPQGLAIRDAGGNNLDSGWDTVTVAANDTYTYSKQVVFKSSGVASLAITGYQNGQWTGGYPSSEQVQTARTLAVNVLPSPTIVVGLSSSPTSPSAGQSVTLSFQVENFGDTPVHLDEVGVAVRDPQGVNRDPRWDSPTIAAGQTYTYSVTMPFNKAGNWMVEIQNYSAQSGWNSVYPVSENPQVVRKLNINVTNL